MNYPKLLDNLRSHPGLRDHRQKRVARLLFKVTCKLRSLGLDANRKAKS